MTMVVRPESTPTALDIPATQDQAIARLMEWAQAADAAYLMAQKLCGTQFSPVAYRGKPEEATAAILAGAEVGLSPMASLRAFDNIQGTPAPKAVTLRAIVQAAGHHVRIDESTEKVAVVSGRRKGDTEWQTSTWTIERATQMGLTGKDQWKKQPAAMLIARATSEVCRWIASDAIMGMPYSSEEIYDGGDFEPRPAPRRVTAAEILAAANEPPASTAPPEHAEAAPVREPMTKPQQGKMHALFTEVGIADRDKRMGYVNEILAEKVGPERRVESSNELSKTEAGHVIDALQSWADQLTEAREAEVVD